MSQVTLLYKLQEIDNEIRSKKERLGTVMVEMKEPEALVAAQEAAKSTAAELAGLQQAQRDLELQNGTLATKFKSSNDRLYSGKVTNSRELEDLQKGVADLTKRRAKLEDEILMNMLLLEEATEAADSAENNLTTMTNDWQRRHALLNDEKLDLATQLSKLLPVRKEQASKIEPKTLKMYMEIARKRKGSAVAKLKIDRCEGCAMSVSIATVKSVDQGQITYCGNCGRILI